jgi:phosphoglucosamine mutase
MKDLFGTDGIRGHAYQYPLDLPSVRRIGKAMGAYFGVRGRALVGMDTRESCPDIAKYLVAGLKVHVPEVHLAGVISTPALAWIARVRPDIDLAVMISASHNPFQDNGIKVFSKEGTKLPDETEEAIEARFCRLQEEGPGDPPLEPPIEAEMLKPYLDWLFALVPGDLFRGVRLAVDTAHGSLAGTAQQVFRSLGAEVTALGERPDGRNINAGVGSQHPEACREAVKAAGAFAGICFDGDGDRVVLIADDGRLLDGDDILYLLALQLQEEGRLPGEAVVATVMSNLGLEHALHGRGITLLRASVGDRYVWQEMVERGAYLGGEQSGHIIHRHYATTGDGLLTGLLVLAGAVRKNLPLSRISLPPRFPQKLVNLPVREKVPLDRLAGYADFIKALEKFLDGGRLSVRYSGTEMRLRIMAEAETEALVDRALGEARAYFQKHLCL